MATTPDRDPQLERALARLRKAEALRAREKRRVARLEAVKKREERKREEARCYAAGKLMRDYFKGGWTDPEFRKWVSKRAQTPRLRTLFDLPPLPESGE